MAQLKISRLRYEIKEFPCSGENLDGIYQRVKEFISLLPAEASQISTRFDYKEEGYGSGGVVVEVNWCRPPTAAEIQAEKNADKRVQERKLAQYHALKKELGL